MKLIIAGSRRVHNLPERGLTLLRMLVPYIEEVVSGGADGIDTQGENWAWANNLPVKRYPVGREEWRKLGKKAGPLRNKEMGEYADACLAFPLIGGSSTGTWDMIRRMRKLDKPVWIVPVWWKGDVVESS